MSAQVLDGVAAAVARARRLLASCRVVLLDMNSTFMFGEDRLGPGEDFGATYRAAGGRALTDAAVADAVRACVAHMGRLYDDPAHADDFPGVLEVLGALPASVALPAAERVLLAEVVARHELGRVPATHADAVRALACAHRLGLVANIWAPKDLWLAELARAGLADVFAVRVFSSDSRRMKPSPALFAEALRGCGVHGPGPHPDVVCIGDSLRCDVGGARAAGLRTIWINPTGTAAPADAPQPDAWVPDLRDLAPMDRAPGGASAP
jgi:FMN phosphatase YigB (HAD superfamily)